MSRQPAEPNQPARAARRLQRPSARVFFIIGGALLAILTAAIVFTVVISNQAIEGAKLAFTNYYLAAQAENWDAAHRQLSPRLQALLTPKDLADGFGQVIPTEGKIVQITVVNADLADNQVVVEGRLQRERSDGPVSATLTETDAGWQIDGFNSP